ncbi:MAG: hypothetical protein KG003_00810, partial [Bacteroidetes bacterium]|nr:hypothetical protein [Bacteroidota bacterium]
MFNKYTNKTILMAALATYLFTATSKAATTYTSNTATGNWSTNSVWSKIGTGTPVTYKIQAGHTITMDVNVSNVDTVWVAGTLDMGNNKTLSVNSNGTVILDWGGVIQGGSNNTGFIMIGSSFTVYGPFTSSNMITSGPRWMTAGSVTAASGDPQGSFSPLMTLLPVDLASIRIEKNAAAFELQWSVLGEANQNTFTIEISSNGKDFYTTGTVAGSEEITSGTYSFNLGIISGAFYVRLSQIDANGATSILATKYISNKNNQNEFQIFPTVVNNGTVNAVIPTAGTYTVTVYNLNMQVMANT